MAAPDVVGTATYRTTYGQSYRGVPGGSALPPVYHQQPAIELQVSGGGVCGGLSPRAFPLIPPGPRRRPRARPCLGPGLGTGHLNTQRYLDQKPIVRTVPPSLTSHPPPLRVRSPLPLTSRSRAERLLAAQTAGQKMVREVRDALCERVTWTSTTGRAMLEAALPIHKAEVPLTTYEVNADQVVHRPRKYHTGTADWQRVSRDWDRTQTRGRTSGDKETVPITLRPSRLLPRRRTDAPRTTPAQISQIMKDDRLNTPYVSQNPGYAGFLPRSPIEAPLCRESSEKHPTSIMRDSYRPLPEEEYKIKHHHHKGPMSRTVTLTYPYNPFNKLEKRADCS